jgi:hypothetical protein
MGELSQRARDKGQHGIVAVQRFVNLATRFCSARSPRGINAFVSAGQCQSKVSGLAKITPTASVNLFPIRRHLVPHRELTANRGPGRQRA